MTRYLYRNDASPKVNIECEYEVMRGLSNVSFTTILNGR